MSALRLGTPLSSSSQDSKKSMVTDSSLNPHVVTGFKVDAATVKIESTSVVDTWVLERELNEQVKLL